MDVATTLAPPERRSPARARGSIAAALLLGPALLFLLVWYALPVGNVLLMSVEWPHLTPVHLLRFFQEPVYLQVLQKTFVMSAFITIACVVLGYPAAYVIARAGERWRLWLLVAVMLPFTTSMLVRTYAWMAILGRNGVVNQSMVALGFWGSPAALMHNTIGVLVGMVHIMLPFMILSIYSVMRTIDVSLLRAAESLGAPPWISHVTVYFPLTVPGIVGGSLLVFIFSIGFYVTPALLGSPSDVWIAMLVELQVNQLLNWNFGAATALILLAVTVLLYIVYVRLFGVARLGQLT
jgi:putative spermidine/putrescine transport system permease protein